MGPYHATGSSSGLPDTSRKRTPSSPACHGDFVTAIEDHQRAIAEHRTGVASSEIADQFGLHGERLRGIAERAAAGEDVGKRVSRVVDWRAACVLFGGDRDIEITRVSGDAFHRSLLAPELAAHHSHMRAVVVRDLGDVLGAGCPGSEAPSS